jgi:hypothetical protein
VGSSKTRGFGGRCCEDDILHRTAVKTSILHKGKHVSLHHTGSETHAASYSTGIGSSLPRGIAAGA